MRKTTVIKLSSSEVHVFDVLFTFAFSEVVEPGSGLEYEVIDKRPVCPDIMGNTTQFVEFICACADMNVRVQRLYYPFSVYFLLAKVSTLCLCFE